MQSDPALSDTDDDGLDDPAENDELSSVWRSDSDGDSLSDLDEVE